MVWIDFLVSDSIFNYTGKFKIKKIEPPLKLIGDKNHLHYFEMVRILASKLFLNF